MPRLQKLVSIASVCFASAITLPVHANGQFIDLFPKSETDVRLIFDALSLSLQHVEANTPPVVMMLHGPQAAKFLRSAYGQHSELIEQAAKLSAFGVLDVKICEIWLKESGHSTSDLFPFISTVPYGAGELNRLRDEENYTEYALDI